MEKLGDRNKMDLLSRNYVGHLAFIDKGSPYVIPITYYYDADSGYIISYSSEGHKIKSMRKDKRVALCVDEIDTVSNWRSVLVHGEFEEVDGSSAKLLLHRFAEGIKSLIRDKEQRHIQFISQFSSKLKSEKTPLVYKIHILEITGRTRTDD